MAAFLNNCRFNVSTSGTADWVFASAYAGSQSPALAGAVNGRAYKFLAISADQSQWEIAEGVYNSGSFARTTVLYNSAGTGTATGQTGAGSKISFSASPTVAIIGIKEDLISIEEANAFTAAQKSQARTNIGMSDGHLPGIASNAAASAGEVGEVISAGATSGSLSSGVTTAMGSISLTAGDWDISATVQFNASGGTTITDYNGAVSLTSASLTPHGPMVFTHRVPASADHSDHFAFPPTQALTNATTSFYLNARSVFTGTAPTVTWSIRARRMR